MKKIIATISVVSVLAASVLTVTAHAFSDTRTRILDNRFRTLKTMAEDNFMSPPVIRMNTDDRIIVNFDEIGEDNSYLEYRLLHCDRHWQPSGLLESEYVDGFNSQRIEDYEHSYSTFVHYVNYQIAIPNDDMHIIHSGNYLLQVYDPEEPDVTLLQTRFQLSENTADISGEANSRTDRGHYSGWQQLSLDIDTQGVGNINPYQDITIDITQNMREETRRRPVSPLRVNGTHMIYEHQDDLIFHASNEYRRFESVSNAFAGLNVDSLKYMGSNYHVWLKPDRPRENAQYSYDRTQHGRYLVREYNATDSNLGADYVTVNFTLRMPESEESDIYIDGEFTNGLYTDSNRMTYDPQLRAYTASIPVKQGAYNYQYVALKREGAGVASPETIEGDKYETENEYNVSVYFRPPGARADRLVGASTIWSNN